MEINPEYSLEGLMLKLKLQYFGYLMQRVDSLGDALMLGKTEPFRKRTTCNCYFVFSSQSYGFSSSVYGCESWAVKKVEQERIDAFELWCWRRLLRVPWIARISNQSILKEINPEYSLEGLMLKLKLQYFGHLM